MKKLIASLFLFGFLFSNSQAQLKAGTSNDIFDFYEEYAGKEGFTTVYISSKMFQLLGSMELDDEDAEDFIEIAKDLKGIRILYYGEYELDKDDLEEIDVRKKETLVYNPAKLYKEVYAKIPKNKYEDLMVVKSDGTDVKFMVQESRPGVIEELLMLVGDESNFVFMSIVGTIDLKKISRIANSIDVDGLEYLENLDDSGK